MMQKLLSLIAGIFVGAIAFSFLRVLQYKYAGSQPDMAPEMFVLFSPILSIPIVLLAVIIHFLLRSRFTYKNIFSWFLAGIAYSSIFLLLIAFWFLPIVIGIYFLAFNNLSKTSD